MADALANEKKIRVDRTAEKKSSIVSVLEIDEDEVPADLSCYGSQ